MLRKATKVHVYVQCFSLSFSNYSSVIMYSNLFVLNLYAILLE